MSAGITSLAWHPLRHQEHLLALGSESGIVDVLDTSKPIRHGSGSRLYGQSMGSIVYRVAWGPPLLPRARRENISGSDAVQVAGDADLTFIADEKKDKASKNLFVYSICKGKLWFHFGHGRQPCEVGSKLPVPNESYLDSSTLLSDVAFRFASPSSDPISSSFSCIFSVGLLSGDVDIFALSRNESDQDYFHCHYVCRVKIHNKCINSLVWSPDPSYWLAIGSNEIFITITDLKSVLLLASGSHEKLGHRITPELTSHLLRIEGHSNRITSLDWSPFSPGLLLSVSYDGTANVWQISPRSDSASAPSGQEAPVLYNMTPLANFRGHRLRLYAGLWSRQEPDLVITGGECSSIFSWRPSLQAAFQQPPSSRRFRPPLAPKVVEVDSSNVTSLSSHDSDSVVIKSGISLLTPDSGKTGETYETNGSYSVSGPGELTKKHESAGFTIAQICNEDISLSGRARKEKARHGGLMRRMAGEGRDAGGFIRRPSLFPSLFGGPGVCTSPEPTNSCLDFSCIPPVQLNSRLQTALMLTRHMASLEKFEPGQSGGLGPETASPPSLMAALVYGVPDDYPSRRMHLVRLVEAEANRHLAVFTEAEEKAQIRQSGSAPMVASGHWLHLEAYFFLLIWLGRATLVAQSAKLYGYFPYWLLWALQMAVSPPMPIQALDDEIDLLVEKVGAKIFRATCSVSCLLLFLDGITS
ncbi:unnamed protein product [Protopolystoma xenopodis]|uniref:Uncharacterized protein n=1 Tax=Protopolystoma xenopodis TaxID=117903 RepID=A0A448WST4_9PLAT|nr:unnamed protein product [Protopolystoma xenopodis]